MVIVEFFFEGQQTEPAVHNHTNMCSYNLWPVQCWCAVKPSKAKERSCCPWWNDCLVIVTRNLLNVDALQKKPEAQSQKRSIEDTHSTHHSTKKKRISLYDKPSPKEEHPPTSVDRHSNSNSKVSSTTDISDKKENIDGKWLDTVLCGVSS